MAQFYDTRLVYEGTLPAAGATFTTDPIAINTYADVTLLLNYERGAAGGAINIVTEVSPDNAAGGFTYFAIGESQSAVIVPGTDVIISTQRSSNTYTSTSANIENVTLPTLPVVGSYVRFVIRESGVPVTPGMCRLTVFLRGNQ
jgi:hypothetical protein